MQNIDHKTIFFICVFLEYHRISVRLKYHKLTYGVCVAHNLVPIFYLRFPKLTLVILLNIIHRFQLNYIHILYIIDVQDVDNELNNFKSMHIRFNVKKKTTSELTF